MKTNNQQNSDKSQVAPAQKIALLADILRDVSARGLHFSTNIYDHDNYQKVQDVALELVALATGQTLTELEPLRATIFAHPAPLPVGDAAIINDEGKILLIRRADNKLWAMPGGGIEVGETAAEGTAREALEEAGVYCEPIALVGLHDSRLCGTQSRHHLYQISFLCRPIPGMPVIEQPSHAHEVLEKGWFAEEDLPDDLDPGHASRIPEAFRVWHGNQKTYFDPVNKQDC